MLAFPSNRIAPQSFPRQTGARSVIYQNGLKAAPFLALGLISKIVVVEDSNVRANP